MRTLFQLTWKSLWYLILGLWLIVKWSGWLVWLVIKGMLWLCGVRFAKPSTDQQPLPMLFPDGETTEAAVAKVGSVVPIEEDDNLRTFNILNAEGEIYRINTALPGPFHGPVWTKILGSYETQQTLAGRLVRPVYDPNNGTLTGYAVLIGKVKAFLPVTESLFPAEHAAINVRVAVTAVDPVNKKLTVSVKRAYQMLFAKKSMGQAGQETDGLFWDYDEEFVYLLLPGEYVGQAQYTEPMPQVAAWMGTLTRGRLESVHADDQTAIVTLAIKQAEIGATSVGETSGSSVGEPEAFFDLEEPQSAS